MFATLREMADDLFGDDDSPDKDNYITEHMKRLGYKARMIFEDADDNDGGSGDKSFTGSIFGGGKREREVRERGPQRRASGGGFGTNQYG